MFWAELVIFNWSLLIGLLLRVTLISGLTKETFAVVKPPLFFFPIYFALFPLISYVICLLGEGRSRGLEGMK